MYVSVPFPHGTTNLPLFSAGEINKNHVPKHVDFGLMTSTDVLHRHLVEYHATAWLKQCEDKDLQVPTKQRTYKNALNKFRAEQGRAPLSDDFKERSPFSQEVFIDTLIAWIVADDQVLSLPHF